MNLIIDIGNTLTKVALFKDNILQWKKVYNCFLTKDLEGYFEKENITHAIISSVGVDAHPLAKKLEENGCNVIFLTSNTPTPIKNCYKTPQTLGMDRLANVAGAIHEYPHQNILAIDAGTCITYDFVDARQQYWGGSISPGIAMRYKSLHQFTAHLPLLEQQKHPTLIGYDTTSSIHSGVVNGTIQEMKGIIAEYESIYENLIVLITGGDLKYFDKILNFNIFAVQNLLIIGLNQILSYNFEK